MKFDDILIEIGEFGRYQKRMYFLVCLMVIIVASHQLAQVFLVARVDHWCRIPGLESENCTNWETADDDELLMTADECLEAKKRLSVPSDPKTGFSKCEQYEVEDEIDFDDILSIPDPGRYGVNSSLDTIDCRHGWVYDTSQYKSTVVTEFDLVCGNGDLPEYSASIYFTGVLIGTFSFGSIADRFGRYPTLFFCLAVQFIFGIGIAFAYNFWTFTWLRFILGTVNMSIFILAFVIGTEFVGPSWRGFTGMGVEFFFAFGYMFLAILAYFIRDWRTLQLVISVPIALFFLLIPVLPESARWLIAQGNYSKAEQVIRKVAEANGSNLPTKMFEEYEESAELKEMDFRKADTGPRARNTFIDLFKWPHLRKETLNLMFNMLVNNLVYYGLSMSTSSLGVNDYVAFFISGAVEVPGYLFALLAMNRWGRRPTICFSLLLGGVACVLTTIIPIGAARTTVAMIGKFGISSSFGIIYIYVAECMPTPVRTAGVGLCSMSGRLGGIVAPLILVLSKYWQPFPLLIFGCSAILAGAFSLLLPETLGKSLPETIEEGEAMGRDDIGISLPWKKTTPRTMI